MENITILLEQIEIITKLGLEKLFTLSFSMIKFFDINFQSCNILVWLDLWPLFIDKVVWWLLHCCYCCYCCCSSHLIIWANKMLSQAYTVSIWAFSSPFSFLFCPPLFSLCLLLIIIWNYDFCVLLLLFIKAIHYFWDIKMEKKYGSSMLSIV